MPQGPEKWIIYVFAALYLLALCLVGGMQGVKGAAGLVFTFFCILFVYLPLVYQGHSPFWVSVFVCTVTTIGHHVSDRRADHENAGRHGRHGGWCVHCWTGSDRIQRCEWDTGWNVSDIESLLTIANTNSVQVGGLLFFRPADLRARCNHGRRYVDRQRDQRDPCADAGYAAPRPIQSRYARRP